MRCHTCPECEGNIRHADLIDGALPPHRFNGQRCIGTGFKPEPTYKVHINGKWRRFATMAEAKAVCDRVFQSSRVVLTIIAE